MDAKLTAFVENLVSQVIECGEDWEPDWIKMDLGSHRKLSTTNLEPYRGSNQFFLGLLSLLNDLPTTTPDGVFTGHIWGGSKTWIERGFMMIKGTKSLYRPIYAAPVTFCNSHDNKCESTCRDRASFTRVKLLAPIFHVSQVFQLEIEGQELADWPTVGELPEPTFTPSVLVDNWKAAGMVFRETDPDGAFYVPTLDYINLPPVAAFRTESGYYGTLTHEAIHWTGHESRLNRKNRNRFGDHDYAIEELTAEIGSALVSAELGLEPSPHPEHAAYLKSWLAAIKADPTKLYDAAVEANKASEMLVALAQLGEMAA